MIRYEPQHSGGPGPTNPRFTDSADALGLPDFPPGGSGDDEGSVSLGHGGLIELMFVDSFLSNSGDATLDIHIFEIGSDVEDTFIAVRPTVETKTLLKSICDLDDDDIFEQCDLDNDGFFEIGRVSGSTSSIDIDAFFSGFDTGRLVFDAVQLVDDLNEGNQSGETVGADIDAVGAITSISAPVGGSVIELTPRNVLCWNITTGESVSFQTSNPSWDCEAAGLIVAPGDRVFTGVEGIAQ